MKAVTALGSALTELPAGTEDGSPRAGMSFAVPRAMEGLLPELALATLAERLSGIAGRVEEFSGGRPALRDAVQGLRECADALLQAR
jgi:hypothetical protein